jgi:predicted DCC family thiol-disulfide oxidoreductase YuxK
MTFRAEVGANAEQAELRDPGSSAAYAVEMFYDGECPLCLREVRLLRRLDAAERIRFTDISAPDFEPRSLGLDHSQLMAKIHARLPSGEIVEGVEVFRKLYEAVGYERWVRFSRAPLVAGLLDHGYGWFARNRLRLTGRCETGACAVRTSPSKGRSSGSTETRASVCDPELEPPRHGDAERVVGRR